MSAAHADDPDAEHPLFARLRPAAPDHLVIDPPVPITAYRDGFGNWCSRIVAPAGRAAAAGRCDRQRLRRRPTAVDRSAHAARGARTCPTTRSSSCSGAATARPTGCRRRPGSCSAARRRAGRACRRSATSCTSTSSSATSTRAPTKTAWEAFNERTGVCRDFAHLAVTLLPLHEHPGALLHRLSRRHRRAADRRADGFRRLVRGLSSAAAGTPSMPGNNIPRIGRVLIARGRDAADVAISTTFGPEHPESVPGLDRRDRGVTLGSPVSSRQARPISPGERPPHLTGRPPSCI